MPKTDPDAVDVTAISPLLRSYRDAVRAESEAGAAFTAAAQAHNAAIAEVGKRRDELLNAAGLA